MFQSVIFSFTNAAGKTLTVTAAQAAKFVGQCVGLQALSYAGWKINQIYIDPLVEHTTGRISDWADGVSSRRRRRRATWMESAFEAELARRVAEGDISIRRRKSSGDGATEPKPSKRDGAGDEDFVPAE